MGRSSMQGSAWHYEYVPSGKKKTPYKNST